MSKRDSFAIFWPSFEKTFTEKVIASAWSNMGVLLFDPKSALDILYGR